MPSWKIVPYERSLAFLNPEVIKYWHPTKNKDITPESISASSGKLVKWFYPYDDPGTGKHFDFEWDNSPARQIRAKCICPFLNPKGSKVWVGFNDLFTKNPELEPEWDYVQNEKEGIKPENFTPGSTKEAHWICPKGHSYHRRIIERTLQKTGCPFCSNIKVQEGINDLTTTHPEILIEWAYSKNAEKGLFPTQMHAGSRTDAIWRCINCEQEYPQKICTKIRIGIGKLCPFCAHRKAIPGETDLLTYCKNNGRQDLIDEWNTLENDKRGISIDQMLPFSEKTVSWKCSYCGNVYDKEVNYRMKHKNVCQKCKEIKMVEKQNKINTTCKYKGKDILKVIPGKNDLLTYCKDNNLWDVINDWNYTTNDANGIYMDQIFPNAKTPVSWKCSCGNIYEKPVKEKIKQKFGCKECKKRIRVSFPEIAILFYLKQKYSNVIGQYMIEGSKKTIDIFLPDKKIGIEYDGAHFHKGKQQERDIKKNTLCKEKGITLIRIRENGLLPLEECINITMDNNRDGGLEKAIKKLFEFLHAKANIDLMRDRGTISDTLLRKAVPDSISTSPKMLSRWDSKRNLTSPYNVSLSSDTKYYWTCENGYEDHSYMREPYNQNRPNFGCPYCSNHEVKTGFNDLAFRHPIVSLDWDSCKNGNIRPDGVLANSTKKYFWKCHVCGYENPQKLSIHDMVKRQDKCLKCKEIRIKQEREGTQIISRRTGEIMTCLVYNCWDDITVKFEDGTIALHKSWNSFMKGQIGKPSETRISTLKEEMLRTERIGKQITNRSGETLTCLDYRKRSDIDVMFPDGTIAENKSWDNFIKGTIKKPKQRIGVQIMSKSGELLTCIEFRGYHDVDIMFPDNTIVTHKSWDRFEKGLISRPKVNVA